MKFVKQLHKLNITPEDYLNFARMRAKKEGYNPKLLFLSDDDKHKLIYDNVPFGAVGYNDFILYSVMAVDHKITKEQAINKRINYRKRAYDMMIKSNNKFSPASLSYFILW